MDDTGRVVDVSSSPNSTIYSSQRGVEQDPDQWWTNVLANFDALTKRKLVELLSVRAIGVSSQGAALIPVDESGNALCPAMTYLDTRATKESAYIRLVVSGTSRQDPVNRIEAWNPLAKMLWLKNNRRELYERTFRFLGASGFICCKLTGEFSVNMAEAGINYLFDYDSKDWDANLVELLGIDAHKLPVIRNCTEILGEPRREVVAEFGINPHAKVLAGGEDTSAEVFSADLRNPESAYYFMGTSSNFGVCIDENGLASFKKARVCGAVVFPHLLRQKYLVNTTMLSTGSTYEWFIKMFCLRGESVERYLAENAETIDSRISYLVFHPYLKGKFNDQGEDQTSLGAIFGLTIRKDFKDLVKMIYEGCSYELMENLEQYEEAGFPVKTIHIAGGVSKNKPWCQAIADVTGRKVIIRESVDSARGMAALAFLAAPDDRQGCVPGVVEQEGVEIQPRDLYHEVYSKIYEVYCELRSLTRDSSKELVLIQNSCGLPKASEGLQK